MHPTRRRVILWMVLLIVIIQCGCNDSADSSREPLNWKHVEAALAASDIHTIHDLFAHFSKLPIDPKTKAYYANCKTIEDDFESLDKYINNEYQQVEYPDVKMSPEVAKRMMAGRIRWKAPAAIVDDIKRVYQTTASQPNKLERIAAWGNPIYFTIFTDGNGVIVGWLSTVDSH